MQGNLVFTGTRAYLEVAQQKLHKKKRRRKDRRDKTIYIKINKLYIVTTFHNRVVAK